MEGLGKSNGVARFDGLRKGSVPDYTELAYKEAVSRLRYLLNESYVPNALKFTQPRHGKAEESDEESAMSVVVSDRTRIARLAPYRKPMVPTRPHKSNPGSQTNEQTVDSLPSQVPPELMAFIERQEDYIEQLEKESQYCRDELGQLLGKVKDLIAENEALHEQQKNGVLRTVFNQEHDPGVENAVHHKELKQQQHRRLEGPSIMFESRISELEAQLTQSRIDLRKANEEAEYYRKKTLEGVCAEPSVPSSDYYKQIDTLQREKRELNEQLQKLQSTVSQIKDKEVEATKKIKRSLDVVDKAQFEKQQAELEVHRLKSELDHQHERLLEVLSDQTRKVSDERGQAERRYLQHVEQLNNELASQRDIASKLQLELEKHLRIEDDLRRDLNAKNMTIESVRKELNNKISSLQSELSQALTDRDTLEQELTTNRMTGERSERINRQETSRLQVELTAVKQRLERADSDHMHCRKENLRLSEQIASLENELMFYKIRLGEKEERSEAISLREKELTSRISDVEVKHVETVAELEGLIESQSQAMAQLKAQCNSLTQRLEEASSRHKAEMANLQSNVEYLSSKLESTMVTQQWDQDETNAVNDAEIEYEESPGEKLLDEIADELEAEGYSQVEKPMIERQASSGSMNKFRDEMDERPFIPERFEEEMHDTRPVYPISEEHNNETQGYVPQQYQYSGGSEGYEPVTGGYKQSSYPTGLQDQYQPENYEKPFVPDDYVTPQYDNGTANYQPEYTTDQVYQPNNLTTSDGTSQPPMMQDGTYPSEYPNDQVYQPDNQITSDANYHKPQYTNDQVYQPDNQIPSDGNYQPQYTNDQVYQPDNQIPSDGNYQPQYTTDQVYQPDNQITSDGNYQPQYTNDQVYQPDNQIPSDGNYQPQYTTDQVYQPDNQITSDGNYQPQYTTDQVYQPDNQITSDQPDPSFEQQYQIQPQEQQVYPSPPMVNQDNVENAADSQKQLKPNKLDGPVEQPRRPIPRSPQRQGSNGKPTPKTKK